MAIFTGLGQELRGALHGWLRRPGYAALAAGTLGLGMAVVVGAAALLDAYLLRGLPYPGAARLYDVRYSPPGQPAPEGLEKADWSRLDGIAEHQIAWDLDMFYLTGPLGGEAAPGAWVTPGFAAGLGIRPALGRGFEAADFRKGAPQTALISHALWQKRYGGDPEILGKSFPAYVSDRAEEAELFTVIGVLPEKFWHFNPYTQILAPLRAPTYPYQLRLRPGVTSEQAAMQVGALVRSSIPGLAADWKATVISTHAQYTQRVRPLLEVGAAAALIVLLLACANVAFLLVVRAAERQREMGIRLALGAPGSRIVQMLCAEALVLGAGATLLALGLASWGLETLGPLVVRQLGRAVPGGEDALRLGGLAWGAAGLALLVTLGFGMLPLTALSKRALPAAGHRAHTSSRGAARVRRGLIALEVAGSVVLLAGAGLMVRTMGQLTRTDLGIRPERIITSRVALREQSYPTAAAKAAFAEKLLDEVRALGGVRSAAVGLGWVMQAPRSQRLKTGAIEGEAAVHRVSAGYFETLGIALRQGRLFARGDRQGAEPVALASESLARRMNAAVGDRLDLGQEGSFRVAGIVGDVRQSPRDEDFADLYVPLAQSPGRFISIYVETEATPAGWAAPLRDAVRRLDSDLAVGEPERLAGLIDSEFAQPRFLTGLLAGLGLFAALLALLGVYGLVAFAVRQRQREMAIRMAVGAEPGSLASLMLRQGMWVVGGGALLGAIGAAGLGQALRQQLFGVTPADPLNLLGVAALLGIAALAAMAAPARRAARTDPAVILRED